MLARKELTQTDLDLLACADRLQVTGWCKGARINAVGEHCLLGVIDDAMQIDYREGPYGSYNNHPTIDKLASIISGKSCENPIHSRTVIVHWNNNVCKSKDEAVAKLREAAYS